MKNTILTIALPVHNEINYLPKVLQSIDNQTNERNRDLFEVLISDNFSSDGTVEYLQNIDFRFNFRINLNNEDKGADANFNFVVADSRSEYVWLLGGQDCPTIGSIDLLISKIVTMNPDLLLLNFAIYNEKDGIESENTAYDNVEKELFTSTYNFFVKTGGPGLAMSSNVFKKQTYLEGSNSVSRHKNWAHIESLYTGMSKRSKSSASNNRYVLIRTPMFTLLREKEGWWNSDAVLMNYLTLIEIGIKVLSNPFINYRIRYRRSGSELRRSLLIYTQQGGSLSLHDLMRLIACGWPVPKFWMLVFPTIMTNFPGRRKPNTDE
jgi:glycosyltransferase involved in cell wall biosynthesis